jgi:hypothetical protein
MKGYKLSTDYIQLWKLIQQGYRIPAWIKNQRYGGEIQDIVEVKKNISGKYMVSTRGHGYEGLTNTREDFIETCEYYSLEYVMPEI